MSTAVDTIWIFMRVGLTLVYFLNFYITKNSNKLIVTQSIHKKIRPDCNFKSCYQLLMINKDDFGIFTYIHLG